MSSLVLPSLVLKLSCSDGSFLPIFGDNSIDEYSIPEFRRASSSNLMKSSIGFTSISLMKAKASLLQLFELSFFKSWSFFAFSNSHFLSEVIKTIGSGLSMRSASRKCLLLMATNESVLVLDTDSSPSNFKSCISLAAWMNSGSSASLINLEIHRF